MTRWTGRVLARQKAEGGHPAHPHNKQRRLACLDVLTQLAKCLVWPPTPGFEHVPTPPSVQPPSPQ
ncbi:hypothetical protein HaLaN_00170, partial [Haematococcus lacustris]